VLQIDDAERGSVQIDEGFIARNGARRDLNGRQRAGKAGDGGIAERDQGARRLLRVQLSGKAGEKCETIDCGEQKLNSAPG